MKPKLEHLQPSPELALHLQGDRLALTHGTRELAALQPSLGGIYALFDSIDPRLLLEGLRLHIAEKALRTPLGFELFMHVVMINMVHCVFPRSQATTPLRSRLQAQSMDSEVNAIRNTQFVNELNHFHILSNRLQGLPAVIALPGPSLDVSFLQQHRGSFVLLSAGRAAVTLFEAGIEPDFVYMQDVNAAGWDNSFGTLGDRKLGSVLVTNPLGRHYKFHHNFARVMKAWNLYPFEEDRFPKLEEIPPSSVSGAYSVARLLGCDPILFLGNDCGENAPPPEGDTLVEQMTNHPFQQQEGHIVFEPTRRKLDLRLRFADEFSVVTRNDYVAGAQWLKMRTCQHGRSAGVQVHDQSHTRLCRFNNVIRPQDGFPLDRPCSLPQLPCYETSYDPRGYLEHKKRAYGFIRKQLQRGVLPSSALRRPCSAVLYGTAMALKDLEEPAPGDMKRALANAETLLEHIETVLTAL